MSRKKISVFVKLCLGMSYGVAGLEFNVSKLTMYIEYDAFNLTETHKRKIMY